tara:strand:+ start:10926 stop:11747 length:822 start_codon:yes stop_codon:yes gene_type:complete
LKPVVKYQGGKGRELLSIKKRMPSIFDGFNIDRVVEPFCGGAALSFDQERPAILNDVNHQVINLYKVIADRQQYSQLKSQIDQYKEYDHDKLSDLFYRSRDIINQQKTENGCLEKAIAYIIVRQLCFSGMERYNSLGEFNVPFGHYKKLTCNLSDGHHKFLQRCDIREGSFVDVFEELAEEDFVFIDPPYLDRLGYITGDGGDRLHEDLLECCKNTKSNWMIVHSDHEFYRDSYKDFNIICEDFSYSQIFGKNRDHSNAKVKHLYITNYSVTI